MYLGTAVTGSSSSYFLPTILAQLGWTSLKAQYMSIPIWMAAFVFSIANGFISDFAEHRYGFYVGPLILSVIGYALLLSENHITVAVRYMALFFIVMGNFAAVTISITWLNNNIVGKARRGISTAILFALGNCGSVIGSNVYLSNEAPGYATGYGVSVSTLVLGIVAATYNLAYCRYENKQKELGKRDYLLSLTQEEQDGLGDSHPGYRFTY
jgi:hypothetical protein